MGSLVLALQLLAADAALGADLHLVPELRMPLVEEGWRFRVKPATPRTGSMPIPLARPEDRKVMAEPYAGGAERMLVAPTRIR